MGGVGGGVEDLGEHCASRTVRQAANKKLLKTHRSTSALSASATRHISSPLRGSSTGKVFLKEAWGCVELWCEECEGRAGGCAHGAAAALSLRRAAAHLARRRVDKLAADEQLSLLCARTGWSAREKVTPPPPHAGGVSGRET